MTSTWLGTRLNTAAGLATIIEVQKDDGRTVKAIAIRADGKTMNVTFAYQLKPTGGTC